MLFFSLFSFLWLPNSLGSVRPRGGGKLRGHWGWPGWPIMFLQFFPNVLKKTLTLMHQWFYKSKIAHIFSEYKIDSLETQITKEVEATRVKFVSFFIS